MPESVAPASKAKAPSILDVIKAAKNEGHIKGKRTTLTVAEIGEARGKID